MEQIPLINYQILAKTKDVNFAKRVREQVSTSDKSETISAIKSPVPNADSKPLPQNVSTKSSREIEAEFNLPDEDRILTELFTHRHCDCCGQRPQLERVGKKYCVRCPNNADSNRFGKCPQPTPWLNSSAAAIRVWALTQKLTQS